MSNITSLLNFTRTLGSAVMLGIMLFLSLPAATYAVDIIIDNRGPGMSVSNPPGWHVKTMASAYKGQTLRTFNKGAWSTFKFGSLASGKYDVYMHWPISSGAPPDNAAPVVIKHSSGTQRVAVNQRQNGGRWNRLGSWTLNNTAYLTLTNRGNGPVYSDAIKLVPLLVTPPQVPTLSLTANPLKVAKGGAATLSWASQHTISCTASGGWSGSKGTSGGSQTVKNITSNQTYNLTCAGTTKTVSATVKVAVISTPLPPPPPPPGQPLVVGLNAQQHTGQMNASGLALMKELGVHSIRVAYDHGDHDFGVNWAAQNGIGVLFFLGYGEGCNPETAAGRQCYADRSAELVQKYGNKVQYWEVWNEWDGGFGLGFRSGQGFDTWPANDPAMYTDLLCRTHKAIKAVRPNAIVVGGAKAGGASLAANDAWLNGMMNAGAGNCMDMYSQHLYMYAQNRPYSIPLSSSPAFAADKFVDFMTSRHNLFKQKTGRTIPILITEAGTHGISNNHAKSAEYITELLNRLKTMPFIEGIWWYELRDAQGAQNGLVTGSNVKKPAFAAYQAAAE